MIQQFFEAAAQNDHPTLPTFLQLYKILSLYKIIKPPRFGNCIVESEDQPLTAVTLEELKTIFKQENESLVTFHLEKLKKKLDNLIDTENLEFDEICDHDYYNSTVENCIIYYVTGFICRKLRKKFNDCSECQATLNSNSTNFNKPEALLVNIKNRGGLIHANTLFFKLFIEIEKYFKEAIKNNCIDIYDYVVEKLLLHYKFQFPCKKHKEDAIAKSLYYYITMRMRQHANILNRDILKENRIKKKLAKLVST